MILALSLTTIFLACVALYFNWNRNQAVLFFAGFIIPYSLFILTHQLVVYQNNEWFFAISYNHFTPIFYLAGPSLYLFIRTMIRDEFRFWWRDLLHLIPAVVTLIGIFPYLFTPFSEKLEIARAIIADFNVYKEIQPNWLIPVDVNNVLRPLLLVGYSLVGLRLLLKSSVTLNSGRARFGIYYQQTRKWTIFVVIVVLLTSASYFVTLYYFLLYGYEAAVSNAQVWQLVSAFLYVLLPVSLLVSPNVMYGFIQIDRGELKPGSAASKGREQASTSNGKQIEKVASEQGLNEGPKTTATSISEPISEELLALKTAILTYFETEEPYLQKDFKAHDVALYLNVPAHHISYCFSVCFDESFSQLKTRYRIDYAVRLLQEGVASGMTIEAIGQQAGFASKSSFFTAFKEATGQTPQQYLSEVPRVK